MDPEQRIDLLICRIDLLGHKVSHLLVAEVGDVELCRGRAAAEFLYETEGALQRKVYAAMQAGNFDASKNPDSLRDEARKDAARSLRVYFALQEIAAKENISVSDYELMAEITRMAQRDRESNVKAYIRKLQKQRRIMGIRLSLVTSKVMDLLVKKAKVAGTADKSEA